MPNEGGLRSLGDRVEAEPGPGDAGPSSTSTGPGSGPVANEAGLTALGEAVQRTHSGRRGRRRPRKVRNRRRRIVRRVALVWPSSWSCSGEALATPTT